jgi:hypothetical protein
MWRHIVRWKYTCVSEHHIISVFRALLACCQLHEAFLLSLLFDPEERGGIYEQPFQIGIDWWSHLRKVPKRRWISHTYPMWLWCHSLFKISSPGPVFHGTQWLLWRLHKQSSTLHSKCRINKRLIIQEKHNRSLKYAVQGPDLLAHPSYIHTVHIYTYV